MTNSNPSGSEGRPSSVFDDLDVGVQRWIWKQGWTSLHEIQERASRVLLEEEQDLLICAPTAGGKTEAAFIPIVSRLASAEPRGLGCLCLSPLKALINDQHRRLEQLGESANVPVHKWHGDVGQTEKQRVLKQPSGILLITPESLESQLIRRGSQVGGLVAGLRFLVVDELHAFIGNERGRQLQSLLTRVEEVAKRRISRVGLSATLGDPGLAAEVLRPGDGAGVRMVEGRSGGTEIKIQVRGYRRRPFDIPVDENTGDAMESEAPAVGDDQEIAEHLFQVLRGRDNLIFANSKRRVEDLADRLRRMSDRLGVPNEFLPHHGSLGMEYRAEAEGILRSKERPGNIIATTTLEMGIDVGGIDSVAQVGVPPSVASMRQRMGRSGRRQDRAAVMRAYISERDTPEAASPSDQLRASLVQTIAMIELMLEGWCEPPEVGRFHFSTLVQQTLALVAQHGGIQAAEAYRVLCAAGPFRNVTKSTFVEVLRALGDKDLISQADDGDLLLGLSGERLVADYEFYAAFASPEEFRLVAKGSTLGTLPVKNGLAVGDYIIFVGKRWRVMDIEEDRKVVSVAPAGGGRPPVFDGAPFPVHDRIRERMREIYEARDEPRYLDGKARELLREGRAAFQDRQLTSSCMIESGGSVHVFPWKGDRVLLTIALLLRNRGLTVLNSEVCLEVRQVGLRDLLRHLAAVRQDPPDPLSLVRDVRGLVIEKHDRVLTRELLEREFVARELDMGGAITTLARLMTCESS